MPWRLCRFLQRQQEKLYVETPQTTLALSSALLLSAKGYTETQNIANCALSETEFDLFWMEYHFGSHVAASALWLNAGCLGNFLSQLGIHISVCLLTLSLFLSVSFPACLPVSVSLERPEEDVLKDRVTTHRHGAHQSMPATHIHCDMLNNQYMNNPSGAN